MDFMVQWVKSLIFKRFCQKIICRFEWCKVQLSLFKSGLDITVESYTLEIKIIQFCIERAWIKRSSGLKIVIQTKKKNKLMSN